MKKTLIPFFVVLALTTYVRIIIAAELSVPDEYQAIQEAIDAAEDGDIIVVGQGTYYENINFLAKAITVRSLDPEDPNIVAVTVIDGNQMDSVVKFHGKEGKDSVLLGVTVQNGFADEAGGISCRFSSPSIINCAIIDNETDSSQYSFCGGICCYESSPIIDNCIIIRNYSQDGNYGSGICCKSSSPTITHCIISNNRKGIDCKSSSSPTITHCTISNNSSMGISCFDDASPTVINCTISNNSNRGIYLGPLSHFTISNCIITENSISGHGGGIYCASTSSHISECIISENYASEGGGIYCLSSSPAISNCVITGNSAKEGGGISCSGYSAPDITNCIIAGNEADMGGGVYCQGDTYITIVQGSAISLPRPNITNCTIVENTASVSGGGIFSDLNVWISLRHEFSIPGGGIFRFISSPTVSNCILWENFPDQVFGRRLKIDFSDVQDGGYFGRRNINADPLFVDPDAGDYHLQPDSPCINRGKDGSEIGVYGHQITCQRRPFYGIRTLRKY